MRNKKTKRFQKGVSLTLAIIMLSSILSIGLGISTLLIRQAKLTRGIGHSVVAFYAADSGIEQILYEDRGVGVLDGYSTSTVFENNASYTVRVYKTGVTTIKSSGGYQGKTRAIEVQY